MKARNVFALLGLTFAMGAGVFAGVASKKAEEVGAATTTTVYYSAPSSYIGSYALKLNVNLKGDGDDWHQYNMVRDDDKTQGGNPLYKYTYTDAYDGVGVMQFQLYNGEAWVGQDVAISSWTPATDYNGKVYVHDSGWTAYNPDTNLLDVKKYEVVNGGSPVLVATDKVNEGATYPVPAGIYKEGYSFGGWYTDAACSVKYATSTINANTNIYAKYTSGSWSGTVHVDLRETSWSEASANYAIYFMDKETYSTEVGGWSSYVTGTAQEVRLVEVPYNLGFEPKELLVVRYDSAYAKASWDDEKWPTDGSVWGQTIDGSFSEAVRIGYYDEIEHKNTFYGGFPKVIGGSLWADIVYLNSVKLNGASDAEYYSSTVTLAKDTEFKIQVAPYADGDYYADYSTHKSLESSFEIAESGNIKAKVAGTYAFYFDSYTHSTYITSVAIAQADEWAQSFLGADCTASKSGWSSAATAFAGLSEEAKAIIQGQEHVDHKVELTGFVERAVQRYDYIIERYGVDPYTDFLGRVDAGKVVPKTVSLGVSSIFDNNSSVDNTALIAIISVITIVSVSSIAVLLVIKKRKHN